MGEHILQRRGPKRWPPQFFTGQGGGCSCCTPPPPPPPPNVAYYYYTRKACWCPFCETNGYGGDVPCSWQVEIDGFQDGSTSGCAGTTGCANKNGTFILTNLVTSSFGTSCEWSSPFFNAGGIVDTGVYPGNCPPCLTSQATYYALFITYYKGQPAISLVCYGAIPGGLTIQAEWIKVLSAGDKCNAVHVLEVISDHQVSFNLPAPVNGCCYGAPQFVTLMPL